MDIAVPESGIYIITIVKMSVDNKPEIVADPDVTPEKSSEQVVQERRVGAAQEIDEVSNLVPKDQAGGDADVSTQGDSSIDDATNVVDLKKIEASAGRKFDNVDDFIKHYDNLKSRNGDQEIDKVRKDAERLLLLEKQLGVTELNKLLLGISPQTSQETKPEPSKPEPVVETKSQPVVETKPQPVEIKSSNNEVDQRLEKLEYDNQSRTLEKVHPNAIIVVDLIALKAKAEGISFVEAFEGSSELKHLVELKTKEESERSPVVTPSNRTNVDYKNLEQLGLKVMTGKAKESDQISFAKEFFKTRGREI